MKIFGEGIATKSKSGQILEVYFPNIEFDNKKTNTKSVEIDSTNYQISLYCQIL